MQSLESNVALFSLPPFKLYNGIFNNAWHLNNKTPPICLDIALMPRGRQGRTGITNLISSLQKPRCREGDKLTLRSLTSLVLLTLDSPLSISYSPRLTITAPCLNTETSKQLTSKQLLGGSEFTWNTMGLEFRVQTEVHSAKPF